MRQQHLGDGPQQVSFWLERHARDLYAISGVWHGQEGKVARRRQVVECMPNLERTSTSHIPCSTTLVSLFPVCRCSICPTTSCRALSLRHSPQHTTWSSCCYKTTTSQVRAILQRTCEHVCTGSLQYLS